MNEKSCCYYGNQGITIHCNFECYSNRCKNLDIPQKSKAEHAILVIVFTWHEASIKILSLYGWFCF